MLSTLVAACIATSVVGLIGSRRSRVAAALADTLAGGGTCEVSITGDMFGIDDLMKAPAVVRFKDSTLAMSLGDYLDLRSESGCASVIELVGFNRAPPEILLPELLALSLSPKPGIGWTDRNGTVKFTHFAGPTVFLLSFVDGKSTFPLPATLANAIPLIHVDHRWISEGIPMHAQARPSMVKASGWHELHDVGDALTNVAVDAATPADGEVRFVKAATCLDIDRNDAVAHGVLAFSVGRVDQSTIELRLPPASTDFHAYRKAFDSFEVVSLTNHLFEPEIPA